MASAALAGAPPLSGAAATLPGCDVSALSLGYEVEFSSTTGTYAVAGAHFSHVPDGCDGVLVVLLYSDDTQVRHRSESVLAPGFVDRLDPDVWAHGQLTSATWQLQPTA